MKSISLLNTIKHSRFEGFFPKAWDLEKSVRVCS